VALGSVALCCGSLLLYQHFKTGNAYYVVPTNKGFYPGNLLNTHPFIVTGSINYNFYGVQLGRIAGISYAAWIQFIHWAGLLLFVCFTCAIGYYLFKKKWRIHSLKDGFLVFGFCMYMGTVGLLILLSLVLDKYIGPPMFNWTYVSESRYYAFPVFFMQVCCWWYFFVRKAPIVPRFVKWLTCAYFILMAIEITHGLYFVIKRSASSFVPFSDIIYEQPEQTRVVQFIKDVHQQEPNRNVVVTGFSKRYGFLSGLYGASGAFTPLGLNEKLPSASKPAVLLLVLNEKELPFMKPFLQQPGVKLVAQTEHGFLYSYYIEPSSPARE
jgi:hypothetical protein